MDVYCPLCRTHGHVDGDFAYYYECPACNAVFEMGTEVSMKQVDPKNLLAHPSTVKRGELL